MQPTHHTIRSILSGLAVAVVLCATVAQGASTDIEGFTEPYRTINVAASEPGLVSSIDVAEGQQVQAHQVVANLDQAILEASLRIAQARMEAKGQLDSAKAEMRFRSERLENLKASRINEHASQEEADRAITEVAIAEAQVIAAEEALAIGRLEHERILTQIERRKIRSPINGVVIQLNKEISEYVAPTDPVVMTIVQLDQLLAVFSVPSKQAASIRHGQPMRVLLGDAKTAISGSVEFLSPVTNAQSGTLTIKVRLANVDGKYRAGEKCSLLLGDGVPRMTSKPSSPVGPQRPTGPSTTFR
jgi:RND family efflux transporter MFP subunit